MVLKHDLQVSFLRLSLSHAAKRGSSLDTRSDAEYREGSIPSSQDGSRSDIALFISHRLPL